MNSRKPMLIMPCTEMTLERTVMGRLPLKAATAAPQPPSIIAHSSSEPSWAPQTAETL